MKIQFNDLNNMLNAAVEMKKDYDQFCKKIEKTHQNLKQMKEDISNLIILIIIGDGFI